MEQKRVGIWIRVSTDRQVDDESPEVHEERARLYIKARNWQIVEVYKLDAVSGKTVWELPETKRMLKDIRSGHITGIVFSKLARLARNTRELLEFADIFRKEGADLVSLAEQIDTSTPVGRLFFTLISAIAEWEREEIASRVAASVPIRAHMGRPLGGSASFGYQWNDQKQFVIDEKEAPIRKLIYDIFVKYQRKKTTADKLNALGFRTRKGVRFSDTTVDRLLRDTTAKGIRRANYTQSTGNKKQWIVKPKEEWIEVPCPAIVDEQIWEECNAILDRQQQQRAPRGRKSEYLLAGIVTCHCGKRMYVNSTAKKFACTECKNSIHETVMNDIYQEHLEKYLNDLNPRMFIEEMDTELKEKEAMLSATKKKQIQLRKKMDDLVELRLGGELNREHFTTLYKPFEEQVSQLSASISKLQGEIDFGRIQLNSSDYVLSEAKALYREWANMQFSEKRAIAETVTERITVREDTIDIALAYLPTSAQTSSRNFIHALPCLRYESREIKATSIAYPENPVTIGDHIMKKRIELNLSQRHVADILKVTQESLCNWEKNRNEPRPQFYPQIFDFLGYRPIDFETLTLSGKLKSYRYQNGLSLKQLGKILNADAGTISAWEQETSQPQRIFLDKLEVLLGTALPRPKQRKRLHPFSCPEKPITIGDHIRKKRKELNLFQSDVAKIINVRADNIGQWEINRLMPKLIYYPQIIKFLGYLPFEIDTSTLAGRLIAYRYIHGLTQEQLAKTVKASRSSVKTWEDGLYMPKPQMLKKVEQLLAQGLSE